MKFNNTMEYKGYTGSVELSEEDRIFWGKVLGIRSSITYEGRTPEELVEGFHEMIDFYLESCAEDGTPVEIPYKGSFNVRLGQELHREAAIYAQNHDQSLNNFVIEAIKEKLLREAKAPQEALKKAN